MEFDCRPDDQQYAPGPHNIVPDILSRGGHLASARLPGPFAVDVDDLFEQFMAWRRQRLPAVERGQAFTRRQVVTYEWASRCARCGRSWLALGDEMPARCPGCKARGWEHAARPYASTSPQSGKSQRAAHRARGAR